MRWGSLYISDALTNLLTKPHVRGRTAQITLKRNLEKKFFKN